MGNIWGGGYEKQGLIKHTLGEAYEWTRLVGCSVGGGEEGCKHTESLQLSGKHIGEKEQVFWIQSN